MRIIIREAGVEYDKPADYRVRTPDDAARAAREMADSDTECFVALYLNAKNGLIAAEIVGAGILDAALIHPREVFAPAVLRRAAAVMLLHNHPSGDPTPSAEDIRITRQLVDAGRILDIRVLDHVVVSYRTGDGIKHVSMRENGLVEFGV